MPTSTPYDERRVQNASPDIEPTTELSKTIRWWDGVAIALSLPATLFVSLGYSIAAIGTWAAILLWAASAALGAMHIGIYSEMGAMFVKKSGGIALYANEAWSDRFPSMGPLATYAYWFAWATAPAVWGLTIAQILTAQFLPNASLGINLGTMRLDFPQIVALAVAMISWALSMIRLRFIMVIIAVAGVLLTLPVVIFSTSFVTAAKWSTSTFTWRLGSGFQGMRIALAWLFVMAWSSYGAEAVASFIPEFRETVSDTRKAMRISAFLLVIIFAVAPMGITGLLGEKIVGNQPNGFLQAGAMVLLGGGAVVMTFMLIAGCLVLSVVGTADAGRALYQSACDGLTVRQFSVLNKAGVPARAVTLQLAINVSLVLFVKSGLAVMVAGNVGYVLAHLLAVSGFVLLRKDRPGADRPIRLSSTWVPIAIGLALFDALILIVGITGASITGYGGVKEVAIAVGVLSISQVLYRFRRVQDRSKPGATLYAGQSNE
jgi:amino acid transporter